MVAHHAADRVAAGQSDKPRAGPRAALRYAHTACNTVWQAPRWAMFCTALRAHGLQRSLVGYLVDTALRHVVDPVASTALIRPCAVQCWRQWAFQALLRACQVLCRALDFI